MPSGVLPLAALLIAVAGLLLGAVAVWRHRRVATTLIDHQAQIDNPRFGNSAFSRGQADPEVRELWNRVHSLEQMVSNLRDAFERRNEAFEALKLQTQSPAMVSSFRERATSVAAEAPKTPNALQHIPGVLSASEEVRVSAGSRPMVEVRRKPGSTQGELWINRDYKFSDVTADYIVSAFELEGHAASGSYETVAPAVVEWAEGATMGRIQTRGRVRAVG